MILNNYMSPHTPENKAQACNDKKNGRHKKQYFRKNNYYDYYLFSLFDNRKDIGLLLTPYITYSI